MASLRSERTQPTSGTRAEAAATEARREAAERFAVLYQQEFVALTRVADLLLGDWDVAEETVQAVFAEVFTRWSTLDDQPAMSEYLRRAVVQACRGHRRDRVRAARRPAVGDRAAVADPGDAAVLRASVAELRVALGVLSARQRECVVAHFLLEQSEAETGRMLGISVGSVRTHTIRGLQALQKAMGR